MGKSTIKFLQKFEQTEACQGVCQFSLDLFSKCNSIFTAESSFRLLNLHIAIHILEDIFP